MGPENLRLLWESDHSRAGLILAGAIAFALGVHVLAAPLLRRLSDRTSNVVDDIIAAAIPLPLAASALLVGCWYAVQPLGWSATVLSGLSATLLTIAIALWTRAAQRISRAVLDFLGAHQDRFALIEPRTLPLFDITARTLLIGGATYFLLLAWHVDVTAWLASAGVLGVAVGFASKDTLSNLFAGLFIIADAPYKLGDYLIIDDKTRGRVTHIGLRSTRLITRDDVEIIVPNSVMAGARITNESGGPAEWERVRVPVDVAYGSDLDRVRAVLLEVARGVDLLVKTEADKTPRVRFRSFGDSGIRVEVRGWIARPEQRGAATDALVYGIWRAFHEQGIQIPFPQREVRLLGPSDEEDPPSQG